MRSILKPSFLKIVVAIAFFVLSSWLWRMLVMTVISDTFPHGFPFQFYEAWGPCQAGENCSEFNGINLVLDVVIWYVIGAWLVSRFRKPQ